MSRNCLIYFKCGCACRIEILNAHEEAQKLKQAEQEYCYECLYKKALEHAKENTLPFLYGSAKQIQYGTICRYNLLKSVENDDFLYKSETDSQFWIEKYKAGKSDFIKEVAENKSGDASLKREFFRVLEQYMGVQNKVSELESSFNIMLLTVTGLHKKNYKVHPSLLN